MNRTPPVEVREYLRKEVNFGCPVKDCGKPYLTYHHFDPQWHEKEHHNPQGMIALCREHHPEALSWTNQQLFVLKKNPYLKEVDLEGRFNWLRQDLIFLSGGNLVINPNIILEYGDEKIVWFNRDAEGNFRLNMFVRDAEGTPIPEMHDNDWTVGNQNVFDVISPPSGKELTVKLKDGSLIAIKFDELTIYELRTYLLRVQEYAVKMLADWEESANKELQKEYAKQGKSQKEIDFNINRRKLIDEQIRQSMVNGKEERVQEIINTMGNPQKVTTCTLTANLVFANTKIVITKNGLRRNHSVYSGNVTSGGTVFHISPDGGFGFAKL